ncbi:RidA family protein [Rhodoligotrophos defluvii]|uniref:RidA family protein n=1 Tax=Rhodoligotrophos defluvii TaxID=2561934 RepID=UPI0010C945FF|nr:RidA family protein [Rhodoligotrophos defluvii]
MRVISAETLGFEPPPLAPSIGNYAGFIAHNGVVSIVQGPLWGEDLRYVGRAGEDVDVETVREAARLCCANLLMQLREACGGDLGRVKCCYRLGGFINAAPSFTQHSYVMNAASDLLLKVLGSDMRHSRYVVGCSSIPANLVMEVEGWFGID